MKYTESIKPISYIKSHAAEVISQVNENQQPYIVTQNGEAKVVIQDLKQYEEQQEAMKMLKIIAQGISAIERGEYKTSKQAFQEIRKKHFSK
jgi:prevent-host-death family protein